MQRQLVGVPVSGTQGEPHRMRISTVISFIDAAPLVEHGRAQRLLVGSMTGLGLGLYTLSGVVMTVRS
jgi:hypothetical protein